MSLKPTHSGQMSEAAAEIPASQEFVYVDVGGKIFKMLRQTVRNYPDSLLAKLLRDCPDFGKQEQPVYIDRSPQMFNWILEIYRDGSYEETMPRKSAEHLQRELDFYQLPSLEELKLSTISRDLPSAEIPSKKLMREIVEEIKENGLEDMPPDAARAIYNPQNLGFVKVGEHDEFARTIACKDSLLYHQPNEFYAYRYTPENIFILQPPMDELLGTLSKEAQSLGLSIEAKNLESVEDVTQGKTIAFKDLPFLHCCYPSRQ